MKKTILRITIVCISILIIFYIYYNFFYYHNLKLKNIDLSKMDDLEVYSINIATDKEILISNKEDANVILEYLSTVKVKKLFIDDQWIGGYCRLAIVNNSNEKVYISFSSIRLYYNNRCYIIDYTKNNEIMDIIRKYDERMIF